MRAFDLPGLSATAALAQTLAPHLRAGDVIALRGGLGAGKTTFARALMEEHGLWVSAIWFIAKPRLRITANALHTQAEMDQLVEAMTAVREKLRDSVVQYA